MKMKINFALIILLTLSYVSMAADTPATHISTRDTATAAVTATTKDASKKEVVKCDDDSMRAALGISKACGCGSGNGTLILAWVVIAFIVILFLLLALKTNLLRDNVNPQALLTAAQTTGPYRKVIDPDKIPRPYSLSRTQLGVWTIVIASSYVFLSLRCCGMTIPFTASILALMGISAGTAAIGSTIDSSDSDASGSNGGLRHQDEPSEGFFKDILSDANGVSIHRFQNVIFTVVTIIIYLYKIKSTICGTLPDLDETLIALQGISATTYLGLKINENKPKA